MNKSKKIINLLIAAIFAVVLASCGDSGSTGPNGSSDPNLRTEVDSNYIRENIDKWKQNKPENYSFTIKGEGYVKGFPYEDAEYEEEEQSFSAKVKCVAGECEVTEITTTDEEDIEYLVPELEKYGAGFLSEDDECFDCTAAEDLIEQYRNYNRILESLEQYELFLTDDEALKEYIGEEYFESLSAEDIADMREEFLESNTRYKNLILNFKYGINEEYGFMYHNEIYMKNGNNGEDLYFELKEKTKITDFQVN